MDPLPIKEINLTGFDFESPDLPGEPRSYLVATCMFSDDPKYADQAARLAKLVNAETIYRKVLEKHFANTESNALSIFSEPVQVGWTSTGEAVLVVVEGAFGRPSPEMPPQANGHWWLVRTTLNDYEELKADITKALEERRKEINEHLRGVKE
jgi:hypothetical protein